MKDDKKYMFNIISSHPFQERLAKEDLETTITVLQRGIAREIDGGKDILFADKILADTGKDYNSINTKTLRKISEFYYLSCKNNLDEFIGEGNKKFLDKLYKNNKYIDEFTINEFVFKKNGVGGFEYRTCFGSGGTIDFIDELTTGREIEVGDKLVMTSNFLEDETLGQLEKRNLYRYENGSYTSCYESYIPYTKDYITKEDIIEATKIMQEKDRASSQDHENNDNTVKDVKSRIRKLEQRAKKEGVVLPKRSKLKNLAALKDRPR